MKILVLEAFVTSLHIPIIETVPPRESQHLEKKGKMLELPDLEDPTPEIEQPADGLESYEVGAWILLAVAMGILMVSCVCALRTCTCSYRVVLDVSNVAWWLMISYSEQECFRLRVTHEML